MLNRCTSWQSHYLSYICLERQLPLASGKCKKFRNGLKTALKKYKYKIVISLNLQGFHFFGVNNAKKQPKKQRQVVVCFVSFPAYVYDRSFSIASRRSGEELSLPISSRWFLLREKNSSLSSSSAFRCSACPSASVGSEVGMIMICGRGDLRQESKLPLVRLPSAFETSVLPSTLLLLFKPNGREAVLKELLTRSSSGELSLRDLPSASSRLMDDSASYGREESTLCG